MQQTLSKPTAGKNSAAPKLLYDTTDAYKFLKNVDRTLIDKYSKYWINIAPSNENEYFLRWVFAILSVNINWQRNVAGYKAIAGLAKYDSPSYFNVKMALLQSGCSPFEMKAKGIDLLFDNMKQPGIYRDSWYKGPRESLLEFRNSVAKYAHGIKLTKTAFALEMIYPMQNEVVCLDTHLLKLYKYAVVGQTPNNSTYQEIEQHWITTCKEFDLPPTMARHAYWDSIKAQKDTTYWSHVFHSPCKRIFVK